MSLPFLTLAMTAPNRQRSFRRAAVFHLVAISAMAWMALNFPPRFLPIFGDGILLVGIIEGASLIGWRLVQLPKSQALEFLLVSPLKPQRVLLAEALAGFGRFALITFSGLPILTLLVWYGRLAASDLPALILMPLLWGAIAGVGLTVWAYERLGIRRWGERATLILIVIYLIIGVLAAERLQAWLTVLPAHAAESVQLAVLYAIHYNPFGAMENWLAPHPQFPDRVVQRLLIVAGGSLILLVLLLTRAAVRLKGHFHDRHYRPFEERARGRFGGIGERPLSWWAVRRVMEYSGRMNMWLAGGFGLVYAAYIVMGDAWPAWLGRLVFQIFESIGGAPALATGLVVLAAVPAAFQYGLWDASTQDRCKRLELLLLTELDGTDYWAAAAAAAWRRGRGYFLVALILWLALGLSGRASAAQVVAALAAGVLLWGLSFALGFRAFSRGVHASNLGTLLTIGFPLLAAILVRSGLPILSSLIPVGAVYQALTGSPSWQWLPGPLLTASITLVIAHSARAHCDRELRLWYDKNQGVKVLD
jgi:hypothetical protein